MKILFQGDSVTDAFRKPEEINPAFQVGNGYAFLVAARLGHDYPERGFHFINRGVSGERVEDILKRWEKDALDHEPCVLSLLAGVNNTIQAMWGAKVTTDEVFLNDYETMLVRMRECRPDVKFIILEPFLLEADKVTAEWKKHLAPRQKGIAALARKHASLFIPLQSIFDEAIKRAPAAYWAYDGIHPTHAGFQLIADVWIKEARPLLKL